MISEEDYRNIEETLYLLTLSGMYESIHKVRSEPIKKCSDKLDW